ncbi:S-adenosyl-L-methionine-dependent methyltransferase [Copromyces sp. CBS 386.78]|nr:S-adenosyl-L-methionine-dependent methyltransferase [Copromyces sp. CBS 386.78]
MATEPAQQPPLLSNEEQTAVGILPPSHWQQQSTEEDPNDDSASSIGSFISSTASLSESIFKYRNIHGRTYHGEIGNAESWQPNDERHKEALDIAHHTWTVILDGKLYNSPLEKKNIQKVIDIGTGTGMWAIDFADEFPNAEVIGTDITPIQPSWIPGNVKFELDDCNAEWTWADNSIDFIHMRMLFGVVADWEALFRQAYRVCKPGGYTESLNSNSSFTSDDGSVKDDSAMAQWGRVWNAAGKKMGRPFEVYDLDLQRKGMEAAGFVDIQVREYFIPVNTWPEDKDLAEKGLWWKIMIESDLEGYLNYTFNAVMGWRPEETGVYAAQLRKEFKNPKIHGYTRARSVWGRKPE